MIFIAAFGEKPKYHVRLSLPLILRTCVVWVATILMKQIERRECFDVEHLARHLLRIRPGAFSDPISFFVLFALAFRIASLGGWSTYEVCFYHILLINVITIV